MSAIEKRCFIDLEQRMWVKTKLKALLPAPLSLSILFYDNWKRLIYRSNPHARKNTCFHYMFFFCVWYMEIDCPSLKTNLKWHVIFMWFSPIRIAQAETKTFSWQNIWMNTHENTVISRKMTCLHFTTEGPSETKQKYPKLTLNHLICLKWKNKFV